jgi:hypothetical protein
MSNLVLFAGASNGKKAVSFYHGDHLKHAPPTNVAWGEVAIQWLNNSSVGKYVLAGEKISNLKHQWVFVDVREI